MSDAHSIPFIEFPKIARLSREIIVTEKIDGTNAQIYIEHDPHSNGHMELTDDRHGLSLYSEVSKEFYTIRAGSRTQWITPEKDNMGFARWVFKNAEVLLSLGPGSHFGEWWGQGIQRNYGLKEKRFSLFNVSRWGPGGKDEVSKPVCCGVVPVLYRGAFRMEEIDEALNRLSIEGSVAAPGFMRPEGVVIFHTAGGHLYKKTIEKDEQPKGMNR